MTNPDLLADGNRSPFTREVVVGRWTEGGTRHRRLIVTIKFDAEGRLSITGSVTHAGRMVSGGQVVDALSDVLRGVPFISRADVVTLRKYWNEWHLNDLQAGSPVQTAFLKEFPVSVVYPQDYYTEAVKALSMAGLHPDESYIHKGHPYEFGEAWLRVEVPTYVLDFLRHI